MKIITSFLLCLFASTVFAKLPAQADVLMECTSIDSYHDDSEVELKNKSIYLEFEPYQKQPHQRSPFYQLTVTTTDKLSNTIINKETGLVKMEFYDEQGIEKFIAKTGPNYDQRTGQFTSYELPIDAANPFLIYGWSIYPAPQTTKQAVEYRCQYTGILD